MNEKMIFTITVLHLVLVLSLLEFFVVPIVWLLVGTITAVTVCVFKNFRDSNIDIELKRLQSGRFQTSCSLSLNKLTKMVHKRHDTDREKPVIKRNKATLSTNFKTNPCNKFLRDQQMDYEIEKLYNRIKQANLKRSNANRPVSSPFPMNSNTPTCSNRNSTNSSSNRYCIFLKSFYKLQL